MLNVPTQKSKSWRRGSAEGTEALSNPSATAAAAGALQGRREHEYDTLDSVLLAPLFNTTLLFFFLSF